MCESRELLHFLDCQKQGPPAMPATPSRSGTRVCVLAERGNPLRQAGKLPRRRILVQDATSNATRHFRLGLAQSLGGLVLLTGGNRRLDGLDKGPDTADSAVVDQLTPGVAADALFGLRRVRHEYSSKPA